MSYEKTEVPVARSQEVLRRLLQSHKGFGLAVISEQDPNGKEASLEGFQAKVMIDGVPYVIKIMAKIKPPGKYCSDRQKQEFKDQEERRVWRVLYYHMKSIFEASDTGVMEFREMILSYIVTSDGQTVAQHIIPKLAAAIEGNPSRLLPERAERSSTDVAKTTPNSNGGGTVAKKKPVQVDLIADREIKPLEEAAMEYAELRDERQKLLGEEVELKTKLHALMKKHQLRDYVHGDVEINIVVEEENVKVKIHRKKEDSE